MTTQCLIPVIVPAEFSRNNWPGPIQALGDTGLCLTWVVLGEDRAMAYVSHDKVKQWETSGIDWRAAALENLRDRSGEPPYSHHKDSDEGRPLFVALLHDDGFGPSRLLLPHLFDDVFPEGYEVAVPERSCAILYRRTLTNKQTKEVDALINSCLRDGAQPVTRARFAPEQFWSPG